jgi:hypothetical protein
MSPVQHDIRSIAPTVCGLLGVEPPRLNSVAPLPVTGRADRILVFLPDAIGARLVRDFPDWFESVRQHTPLAFELRSMLPPKTPVCFASMFTGALPAAHGITGPVRPVLTCDTVFDVIARTGRRAAIVATPGSSMDRIFRDRSTDYFSEPDDTAVTRRTIELLAEDRHDLVCTYHQEYDDTLHRESSRSPNALAAARRHTESFAELCAAAGRHWQGHSRAVLFCPDHGAHDNPSDGRGTHGDDIPDDMEVTHFFGLETR